MPRPRIHVRGTPTSDLDRFLTVNLLLKFDPKELGEAKTTQLLGGIIKAITDVLPPEQGSQLIRAFEAEQQRIGRECPNRKQAR